MNHHNRVPDGVAALVALESQGIRGRKTTRKGTIEHGKMPSKSDPNITYSQTRNLVTGELTCNCKDGDVRKNQSLSARCSHVAKLGWLVKA